MAANRPSRIFASVLLACECGIFSACVGVVTAPGIHPVTTTFHFDESRDWVWRAVLEVIARNVTWSIETQANDAGTVSIHWDTLDRPDWQFADCGSDRLAWPFERRVSFDLSVRSLEGGGSDMTINARFQENRRKYSDHSQHITHVVPCNSTGTFEATLFTLVRQQLFAPYKERVALRSNIKMEGDSKKAPEPKFSVAKSSAGGQTATTGDGKGVLLLDDGTWEYLKKESEPKVEDRAKGDFSFRKIRWGMSVKEVKASEAPLEPAHFSRDTDTYVFYSATLHYKDFDLSYDFDEGKLVTATYRSTFSTLNKQIYITEFEALKAELSRKYGHPRQSETHWSNDLYKHDPRRWGMAVSINHLGMMAGWKTPSTDISLWLMGDNFESKLIIMYRDIKLGPLGARNKDQEIKDPF